MGNEDVLNCRNPLSEFWVDQQFISAWNGSDFEKLPTTYYTSLSTQNILILPGCGIITATYYCFFCSVFTVQRKTEVPAIPLPRVLHMVGSYLWTVQ